MRNNLKRAVGTPVRFMDGESELEKKCRQSEGDSNSEKQNLLKKGDAIGTMYPNYGPYLSAIV